MSDLRELYQEVILDHSRRPRNTGTLSGARRAAGDNPLCGDRLTVYVAVDGDTVRDVRFEGAGCAISTASASLMTEAVRGCSLGDTEAIFDRFHTAITSETDAPLDIDALGKLAVLTGVRQYPMRVKCASLAWHTLRAALHGATAPVTTE
jgi:nitrogen fixation NifU-like protein